MTLYEVTVIRTNEVAGGVGVTDEHVVIPPTYILAKNKTMAAFLIGQKNPDVTTFGAKVLIRPFV